MTEESKSNATASNVDPLEIAKFEALAHRWWDTSSEFKPLHEINPLRANFIDRLSPVAEKKVIDIGCGGGILSEALTQRGAQVTGIDMGDAPLGVAELHALENNLTIEYKKITAEEIAAERPGQYDVVTCLEMLEHDLILPLSCKPAPTCASPAVTSTLPPLIVILKAICLPF